MKSTQVTSIRPHFAVAAIVFFAATVALLSPATASAQAAAAAAAKAPVETLRANVAKPLKAAQELINAKQFKEAMAKLAEADAIADKTVYEGYILERLRGSAAAALGEHAVASRSFQVCYDSGRLTAAERTQFAEAITSSTYLLKDYKAAAMWAKRVVDGGGASTQIRVLMINALVLADDLAGAAREAAAIIGEDESAGKSSAQEMLRLAGTIALRQKNDAAYLGALEKLVVHYPSNDYWIDFIARVARSPNLNDRYMSDVFRLKMTLGQPLNASQYMFVAQSSKQSGFPIDAANVMDIGFKSSVLSTAEHKQFRELVSKDAADDIKSMARTSAEAAKAKEGMGLFSSGLNYVYHGDPEKGLPMMEEGIARPGIRRLEDARLRLGIAYALSGHRARATETLASVKGTDGAADVARLWIAYAQQRTTAPPAAAAPVK